MSSCSLEVIKQHLRETADYRLEIIEDLLTDGERVSPKNPRIPSSEQHVKERAVVTLWMVSVAEEFGLDHEVLELAINYYDRLHQNRKIEQILLQLTAYTCFIIADKFVGDGRLSVSQGIDLCAQQYTEQEFVDMEALVLQELSWKLHRATPIEIARNFLHVTNMEYDFSEIIKKTQHFIEVCLVDDELCQKEPQIIAIISAECALEMGEHSSFRDGWLQFLADSFSIDLDLCQIAKCQLLTLVTDQSEEDLFSDSFLSKSISPIQENVYSCGESTYFGTYSDISTLQVEGSEMLPPISKKISTFSMKKIDDSIDDGVSSCSTNISPFCSEKHGQTFTDHFFSRFQGAQRGNLIPNVEIVRSEEMDTSS